ncbi:efflux RND transporter permease subunit [Pseudomonas sessilinigenes]|nr:MMPL family transporter [Pseudomonas sessilinigenes]AZC26549.1 Exporter protein, RND family [Pseudomonas sessilinigenes]
MTAMSPSLSQETQASELQAHSGSWIERLVFSHRPWVVLVCMLLTALLAWQALQLKLNASFEKTIPRQHPYIQTFLQYQAELTGLGNAVRISVGNPGASLYDKHYMETLRALSDEVFLIPGVDRIRMKSLWSPSTSWLAVTEEGLEGGPVIPRGFDGSPRSLEQLQANIERSGEIGQTVALDRRSSLIYVPLLATTPDGQALDYAALSQELERLRDKYQQQGVEVRISGFAKVVGDLIDGVRIMLVFFAVAALVAALMVYGYTRCIRSTVLVLLASIIAVVWQLGLMHALGYSLDPYSILVPFLVFAIGMSHGAQKMNGIMQDIGRGRPRLEAARMTFRRLFLAGLTALLADAVGFAVLLAIDIQVIRELAIAASIGVALLIFTNLILLPVLLSYTGVSTRAAARSLRDDQVQFRRNYWRGVELFTQRRWATVALVVAGVMAVGGWLASTHLQIGDLDPGAPELRPESRYNQDAAFMNKAYGTASDLLAVLVTTPEGQCADYAILNKVDALEWQLRQIPGVESVQSLATMNRRMLVAMNEGNPKWYELVPNQAILNSTTAKVPRGLSNDSCSLLTLYAYLGDHKAATLERVTAHVEAFAQENDGPGVQFKLAAGSAGIEAATNIAVKNAWRTMLLMVYAAVIVLCFIAFRSWRAVVIAVLPLMLTSVLAEALMVWLGMGVKVSTLPVIALGVGIGVDYALYILSVTLAGVRSGASLAQAYRQALNFTGRVVVLTGFTLAIGVVTWTFSPIKFQADMGLLLAFMFIWNMLGALILIPALAYWLVPAFRPVPSEPA